MPISPTDGWVMDMGGRMIPDTPQPADGDDYTYTPLPVASQWVSLSEYLRLAERVERIEQVIADWEGD